MEVVRSRYILKEDLLTDWTWGVKEKEILRMTLRFFGLDPGRIEFPLTEIGKTEEGAGFMGKIKHSYLAM